MKGIIKKLNDRGFGFIEIEDQESDLFFHKSALSGVAFEELKEGDNVTFEIEPAKEGSKGPSAVNVERSS